MTIGKLKGLLYRLFKVDSSDQRLSSVDNKVRTLYTSYYSKRVVGDERRYSVSFGISPFSQLKSFNVTVYNCHPVFDILNCLLPMLLRRR